MVIPVFQHTVRAGLHTYVGTASDDANWDGLWAGTQGPYAEDWSRNPYMRFGVNNADGEALAVWRAFAWNLLRSRRRFACPHYDRDWSARLLGLGRDEVPMVPWEYSVDMEQQSFELADRGYVPAVASVPYRPPADAWQLAHQHLAGLFPLSSFHELATVDRAVGSSPASQISLYGVEDADRLTGSLRVRQRPQLEQVLDAQDVFVHLAVVRDRFLGLTSYLLVRSPTALDAQVAEWTDVYNRAYETYRQAIRDVAADDFDEFARTLDILLQLDAAA